LTATALKVRYRTVAQVRAHMEQLKTGRVFIPTEMPLPCGTRMRLALMLPSGGPAVSLDAEVLKSVDRDAAEVGRCPAGMLLAVAGEIGAAAELERRLGPPASGAIPTAPPAAAPAARAPTVLPPPGAPDADGAPALSFEWIAAALAQAEALPEPEPETLPAVVSSAVERVELTPAERERIKPVGEFVMDLTKAMLRTGYYAPEHPGSEKAKRGLHEALRRSLPEGAEISISNRETRERSDILITGVLEEPVSVRALVGAGMAELFVPKLRDTFNRKGIVSVSIRRAIPPAHFEAFVRLMSDPATDRSGQAAAGELLTRGLVENGVSDVSLVLLDDLIALERSLPWRVEMAIQRLAKDLKVLPLFRSESDDGIRRMKLQLVQDILRPLRRPELLKDFAANCHVIAHHVGTVRQEEIESAVVAAFPLEAILPTCRLLFQELERLRELAQKSPGHTAVTERVDAVKRILAAFARRLVHADVKGAQRFLGALYSSGVLAFEELPADVQYLANTRRMAEDVADHADGYLKRLAGAASPQSAATVLRCLRRALPTLAAEGDPVVLQRLADGVKRAATRIPAAPEIGEDPVGTIFRDCQRELARRYECADDAARPAIEGVLERLGGLGIEVLCRVLAETESRAARKTAMAALIRSGSQVHDWVLNVIEDPTQKWYLKRNALILLRHVCRGDADIALARRLFNHTHARVRDEALATLVQLKSEDAGVLAIKALDDPDEKIRWRAVGALGELAPLPAECMQKLLARLAGDPPEDKELASRHQRKVIQVLKAIGGMRAFADPARVEQSLIETAAWASGRRRGLLQRLRRTSEVEDAAVLGAVATALAALGSDSAEAVLSELAAGKTGAAEAAVTALESLRARRAARAPGV
jgi:hypothetical protein